VNVASILSLTGPAGQIGQEVLAGQELAVEYWNSREGPSVNLISRDSKGLPKNGLSAFRSLRAQGYENFVANISGVALSIKPEINDESMLLAIASHPRVTSPANQNVIRYSQTAEEEAKTLSDWISSNDASSAKVVVFHSSDEYGYAFAEAMRREMPSDSVLSQEYSGQTSNIRSLVQGITPQSAYIPVVVGAGQPMAQVIKALRTSGYEGPILSNIGYALTGVKENLQGEEGEVLYTTLDVETNALTEQAARGYKKKYGRSITPDALIGFHSVSLIVSGYKKLDSPTPSQMSEEISSVASSYFETSQDSSDQEIVVGVQVNGD
jgi:ABC-type branched-subunit amino acid transport system substrate-binding protein